MLKGFTADYHYINPPSVALLPSKRLDEQEARKIRNTQDLKTPYKNTDKLHLQLVEL